MTKRKSSTFRRLTESETATLEFVWRWKAANTATLLTAVASKRGAWAYYRCLLRLEREGYLTEASAARLPLIAWVLTKKGFDYWASGNESLAQKRYLPQSLAHDYYASAFHLGDFVSGMPRDVTFVTEQEIQCAHETQLPTWLPACRMHIPDGYTRMHDGSSARLFAIEVELNLKPSHRYDAMASYLDRHLEIDDVLWLCASGTIAERIRQRIMGVRPRRPEINNFVLLEDFKNRGWQAQVVHGRHKDLTVSEAILQKSIQNPLNATANTPQIQLNQIFFSAAKSPKNLARCRASVAGTRA